MIDKTRTRSSMLKNFCGDHREGPSSSPPPKEVSQAVWHWGDAVGPEWEQVVAARDRNPGALGTVCHPCSSVRGSVNKSSLNKQDERTNQCINLLAPRH